MKVLICGSRGWKDPAPIEMIILGYLTMAEESGDVLTVIHGDAPGADKLAARIAKRWGARVIPEPADWDRYGKAAGPIRNRKMLELHNPDVVYAFRSTGKSNGTDNMVEQARDARKPTYVITGDQEAA